MSDKSQTVLLKMGFYQMLDFVSCDAVCNGCRDVGGLHAQSREPPQPEHHRHCGGLAQLNQGVDQGPGKREPAPRPPHPLLAGMDRQQQRLQGRAQIQWCEAAHGVVGLMICSIPCPVVIMAYLHYNGCHQSADAALNSDALLHECMPCNTAIILMHFLNYAPAEHCSRDIIETFKCRPRIQQEGRAAHAFDHP